MRLVCAPVLALATLLASDAAHADPPRTASLSWARLDGAESCIGSLPLARGVEQRLGRPLFVAPAQAQLAVEGQVARMSGGSGWTALVRVAEPSGRLLGERELRTTEASCAALDEPLKIVVGLLLDPDAMAGGQVVVAPVAPAPPAVEPSGAWSVGAAFTLSGGLLPAIAPGVSLFAARWQPGWGATLTATTLRATEASGASGRGTMRLQRVDLGLCPAAGHHGRAHLALCAGPGLAFWNSSGTSFDVNNDDRRVTLLLAAGGQARVKLVGALDAFVSAQVETSLPRVRFSFAQADGSRAQLFETPPLALSGSVGLAGSW